MRTIVSSLSLLGIVMSVGLAGSALLVINQPAEARNWEKCLSGEKDCTKQQAKAFDKCIEEALEDGELTEEEYFACAYSIYG